MYNTDNIPMIGSILSTVLDKSSFFNPLLYRLPIPLEPNKNANVKEIAKVGFPKNKMNF